MSKTLRKLRVTSGVNLTKIQMLNLYNELSEVATATMSDYMRSVNGGLLNSRIFYSLVRECYERVGLKVDNDLNMEQALAVVDEIFNVTKFLIGPVNAENLAEQMRKRINTLYSLK